MRSERWAPWAAVVLLAVAMVGASAVVAGPARGARTDIDRQQRDVAAQRDLLEQQLAAVRAQLATVREQREINADQRALARRQLAATEESVALQRRLVALAERLLTQVREINRKTPSTPAPVVGRPGVEAT